MKDFPLQTLIRTSLYSIGKENSSEHRASYCSLRDAEMTASTRMHYAPPPNSILMTAISVVTGFPNLPPFVTPSTQRTTALCNEVIEMALPQGVRTFSPRYSHPSVVHLLSSRGSHILCTTSVSASDTYLLTDLLTY